MEISDRLNNIKDRLIAAGYVDCKISLDPDATYPLSKALEDTADALEAILDGKTKPFECFGDSQRFPESDTYRAVKIIISNGIANVNQRANGLKYLKELNEEYHAPRRDYQERITELLNANNALVERARKAEKEAKCPAFIAFQGISDALFEIYLGDEPKSKAIAKQAIEKYSGWFLKELEFRNGKQI